MKATIKATGEIVEIKDLYDDGTALVKEEMRFKCTFEKHIKDSLPVELSDAVIRLLDLAGLRGISLELAN